LLFKVQNLGKDKKLNFMFILIFQDKDIFLEYMNIEYGIPNNQQGETSIFLTNYIFVCNLILSSSFLM